MSLVETFRTAPPQRQLTLVGAAAAILCVLLFAAYFLFLHKPYEVLFSNLRPTDAATIVAQLDKKKTPYRLEDGGSTILVPKNIVDSTRLNVMNEDLPLKGVVGFELFNKSDMGLTEFAQKINYQRALQGELARTIMTMDEIDTARVHLSLSEPTIFREDRVPPKASVTLVARPGKVLTPGAVRGIQRLVAAAVPELDVTNVVVLNQTGDVLSGDTVVAPASPEMQAKEAIEAYYSGRVRLALKRAYPTSSVDVTVMAPTLAIESPVNGHIPSIESWSPAARVFPLQVSISATALLTSQEQDAITALCAEAIGFNPAVGDTITVILAPTEPPPPARVDATPAGAAPWASVTHGKGKLTRLNLALALALPLLLLLFAAAFMLERRRDQPRRLTSRQRSEYTRRLKALLDGEEADASVA